MEQFSEIPQSAKALVTADPALAQPDPALLRRRMLSAYGQALELGDVG